MNKQKLIEDLRSIQKDASMATANFGHIQTGEAFVYPTNEAEVTAFIEQRTRIWRETWITGMLEEVIRDIENDTARYRD